VFRIDPPGDPSTVTMVFCSSTSSGRRCMSNRAVISEQKTQQPAHRDRARRAPDIGLAHRAQGLAKASIEWRGGT